LNNYKLLTNKEIIQIIQRHTYKKVYLCGYSNTTQRYLNKIHSDVHFIIDKNYKYLKSTYKHIEIVPYEAIKNMNSACVIVWGNYCKEIIEDVVFPKEVDIFVDIENGGGVLLNKKIVIETPSFSTLNNDTQHLFCKKIINFCIKNHLRFETIPKINLDIFTKREIRQNDILFSYHSVGDKVQNIYRYKESYLKGYITLDWQGYSGWHSLCEYDIEEVLKKVYTKKVDIFFNKIKKDYENKALTKYTQELIKTPLPKEKFIFFPMQIIDDSVIQLSYFEPLELLKKVADILNDKEIKLVVKRHPKCNNENVKKLLYRLEKEKKIIIYKGDISTAIKHSTGVYTINSGVGFEALLYLKPVTTFGKSDYSYCTRNINDLEQLKRKLFVKYSSDMKKKIKQFVFFYLNHICININNKAKLNKKILNILLKREN